jgi:hypothetical protein
VAVEHLEPQAQAATAVRHVQALRLRGVEVPRENLVVDVRVHRHVRVCGRRRGRDKTDGQHAGTEHMAISFFVPLTMPLLPVPVLAERREVL